MLKPFSAVPTDKSKLYRYIVVHCHHWSYAYKSVPFTTSWRTSLLSHSENLQLSGDDKKVLLRVGDILGAMDGENQVGELKLIETTLDDRLEQARLSREKYGKLYRSLGVLAGVGISIFML